MVQENRVKNDVGSRQFLSAIPPLTLHEPVTQASLKLYDSIASHLPNSSVHDLFARQAEHIPDAIAVVDEYGQLTYGELDRRTDQLAAWLQRSGVGPDVVVGVCMERSLEMVVALLGILKAGGAYLPLDPTLPPRRLAFMLQEARMTVLLTQQRFLSILPREIQRLCLDSQWQEIGQQNGKPCRNELRGANLVYVIYTSGSTGKPKGVMNTHQGLLNRLLWMQKTYQLDMWDRVLQKTPYSFDVSVWEFFLSLLAGAQLVMARPEGHRDSAYLVEVIRRHAITTLHFVPSMLRAFLTEPTVEACHSIRYVICSGEVLPIDVQEGGLARLSARMYNLYGPTEASIDVTSWRCQRGNKQTSVPIGRAISNISIYLLDEQMEPVAAGTPGELYIGGVGLARGYLYRPDLTAERFVPNPFVRPTMTAQSSEASYDNNVGELNCEQGLSVSEQPGSRLYRTGDLARYREDGAIEYLGRIDYQVKVRGVRIELGEIEAVLDGHPAVHESIVVAREDVPGDSQLVAYLVPDPQYARPVQQLLHLEEQGLLASLQQCELPNGMTVICQNKSETDFLYEEIFAKQEYARHDITLRKGACVFDVGANIGLFSLFIGQRYKNVTLYAFEPIPALYEILRLNMSLYDFKVKLFDNGLSNEAKIDTITFYQHLSIISGNFADLEQEREVVKAFIRNQQKKAGQPDLLDKELNELLNERLTSQQVSCQMKTLSEVIAEQQIERIDLLKVDVEKSEENVLAGIHEQDWPKITQIIIEVHDSYGRLERIANMLRQRGYTLTIEQNMLLEHSNLYNIYARRPSQEVLEHTREQDGAEASTNAPSWNSPSLLLHDLQAYLKEHLPEAMIPVAFVLMSSMPLTAHGKLDRSALPAPSRANRYLKQAILAPRTPVEELLRDIFRQVLSLDEVSIDDNFFALGGHSLLATQVIARVRTMLQVELPLPVIFRFPTIAALAEAITRSGEQAQARPMITIKPEARTERLPLSFSQERVWFVQQLDPTNMAYHFQATLRLRGRLDVQALERSLSEILRRHEIFRTTFEVVEGQPVQVIHAAEPAQLPLVDVQIHDEAELAHILYEEFQHPMSLAHLPLVRWKLLRLSDQEHVLIHIEHHIVHDGWSFNVFLSELTTLYTAFSSGKPSPLPELPFQFADFACWQRQWMQGEWAEKQLAYWKRRLAGSSPLLALPTDHPRPAIQRFRGHQLRRALPAQLCEALRASCRQESSTLFMLMFAAFVTVLYRYSGQDDMSIGSGIANRRWRETEGLIGMLVNNIILRINVSGNPSFREVLRRVREMTIESYAYQDIPFEKVVEAMHLEPNLSYNPLFQVMFSFHDSPLSAIDLPDLTVDLQEGLGNGSAKFDLNIIVVPYAEQQVGRNQTGESAGINLLWEYNTDLFETATMERMIEHYLTVMANVVVAPEQRISYVPMLTATEQRQLISTNTQRASSTESPLCLHQLFEKLVAQMPEATALIYENGRVSYRELNQQANQLAHYLRHLGVGPETLIGIYMERCPHLIVGILGVLKAGGAYVPMDLTAPQERLAFMLQDTQAPFVLTQQNLVGQLPQHSTQLVCLDTDWEQIARAPMTNPLSTTLPDNLAYVIYTSGSTGRPKGVLVQHANVVRLFENTQSNYHFNEQDVWTLFHSSAFDFSVWEIWGALLYGGSLVIVPYWTSRSPAAFYDLLCRERVTVLNQTPSAFYALTQVAQEERSRPLVLRYVIFGGEALDISRLRPWCASETERIPQFINMYGITETTVHVTYRSLSREDIHEADKSLIGSPLADLQVYVLDRAMQLLPVGLPGELYVAGAGLARGYLDRPELTAERFVPHPFSQVPGARLYRTGDLVRYVPQKHDRWQPGELEYLGRVDQQVKIRGFRIELGEIESVLAQHPAVREAVVAVREDVPGNKRLIAYIVAHDSQAPESHELRAYVQAFLPEYMVPTHFISLPALPLMLTGKLDRQALPVPALERPEDKAALVANTPTEQLLHNIWVKALGIEQIGVQTNFFEAGGHSLLATRVISYIRDTFHVELPLRSLFEEPTIAGLARQIETISRQEHFLQTPPVTRVDRHPSLPLSYSQQQLWFLDQLEPGNPAYNIAQSHLLEGPLQVGSLQQSLNMMVQRHEALRTTFTLVDEQAVQRITPELFIPLFVIDVSALTLSEQDHEVQCLAAEEALLTFDLTHGPLLRAKLIRMQRSKHALLVTMHHIISDGWSISLLMQEVSRAYNALLSGGDCQMPELPLHYVDYACWQRETLREQRLEKHIAYWQKQLAGLSSLRLPLDCPRPALQSYRGDHHHFCFSPALLQDLHRFSQQEGVTLFMTLLAAIGVQLYHYCGQDDIAIGTPVANRTRSELENIIGFFTNTLVLRTDLSGNPNFHALLKRIRETTVGAYTYQDLPFEQLVDLLQPQRSLGNTPLFQVMLSLENVPPRKLELMEITAQQLEIKRPIAKFDLLLMAQETEYGLKGYVEYNTDLFYASTIEQMVHDFEQLLQQLMADPDVPIGHHTCGNLIRQKELEELFEDEK